MRQFFVLSRDKQLGQQAVVAECVAEDFDAFRIQHWLAMPAEYVSKITFRHQAGSASDCVHDWPIVSPRALAVLGDYARFDMQAQSAAILDSADRPALPGYLLVNVRHDLEGVIYADFSMREKSTCMGRTNTCRMDFAVRAAKVPPELHLFRPKEIREALVVSDELAAALRAARLSGFRLTACASVLEEKTYR